MAKHSKLGRQKVECQAYRENGTREKNKALKILKHLKRYPDDLKAQEVLKGLPKVKGLYSENPIT